MNHNKLIGGEAALAGASEFDKKYWALQDEINKRYKESQPVQDVNYVVECLQESVRRLEFMADCLLKKIVELQIDSTKGL